MLIARYAGSPDRQGPLTMGQRNMLRCVLRDDPWELTVGMVWALPPGTTAERVAELAGVLLSRHESLRTTYHGEIQRVHSTGELHIGVHEAADPLEFGRQLARVQRQEPVALDRLQIRISLVTRHTVPSHVVFVVGHLAADGRALEILTKEWADLVAGKQLRPVTAITPIDLAERESAPDETLRHWAAVLSSAPRNMLSLPNGTLLPRLRVQSRRAAEAMDTIVARTRCSHSSVFLTALAALTGRWGSQDRAVITLLSANRSTPELRNYVGTIAQDALMAVDLTDAGFDDLVKRTNDAAAAAFQHARFDSSALWEIIEATNRRRGIHFDRDCVFSDISGLKVDDSNYLESGLAPITGNRLHDDGDTRLTWTAATPMPVALSVWTHRFRHELEFSLWAALPAEDAEEFAHALVRLLCAAAHGDPSTSDYLVPRPRGAGWVRSDNCWVELAAVDRLLAEVLGHHPFRTVTQPDLELGHRLVCHTEADLTPPQIHALCVQALPRHPAAIAPHHYHARGEGTGR